jgi:2-acylglycerol O-acyltransferase 2
MSSKTTTTTTTTSSASASTKASSNDKNETSSNMDHHQHHVRWAPIRGIPIERRLQMLAVCTWISLVFISVVFYLYLFTFPFLWSLLIAYTTFIFFDTAPESGGRRFEGARHWLIWKYFAGYFPVQLIKVNIIKKLGKKNNQS